MVKNYKCPGCGATMEYDPQDGKMHCAFCKSSYELDQIGRRASSDDPPKIVAAERETARKQAPLRASGEALGSERVLQKKSACR